MESKSSFWGNARDTSTFTDVSNESEQPIFPLSEEKLRFSRLFLFPEKFFFYYHLWKNWLPRKNDLSAPWSMLLLGTASGSIAADLKRIFGRRAEISCMESVRLRADIAKLRLKNFGLNGQWYDFNGMNLPFSNGVFDAVGWWADGDWKNQENICSEISRVLKKNGLAVISTPLSVPNLSVMGSYAKKHGLSRDPVLDEATLKKKIKATGLRVVGWKSFRGEDWRRLLEKRPNLFGRNELSSGRGANFLVNFLQLGRFLRALLFSNKIKAETAVLSARKKV